MGSKWPTNASKQHIPLIIVATNRLFQTLHNVLIDYIRTKHLAEVARIKLSSAEPGDISLHIFAHARWQELIFKRLREKLWHLYRRGPKQPGK